MKKFSPCTRRRLPVFVPALLLLCLCLGLGGCFKKNILGSDTSRTPAGGQSSAPQRAAGEISVAGAEAALQAGNMAQAEQIATQVASRPGLSQSDTARISRVLAISSLANRRVYLSATALDRWRGADPQADANREWQDTYFAVLSQLPQHDAMTRANAMLRDESRPFVLRSGTALFLASRQWERGGAAKESLAGLSGLYAKAPDKNQRMAMEYSLFDALHKVSPATLESLVAQVTPENSKAYPHALVRLEDIRRQGLLAGGQEAAKIQVEALREGTTLADSAIFAGWAAPAASSVSTPIVPLAGRTLVLALPLSGSLGKIGTKVARGAELARKEFSGSGHDMGLMLLDTEKADWLDKLAALPPALTIVGGPLRGQDFTAAQARGLTTSRAFLTFMPTLGVGNEEGRGAWRFFPGPEDQLNALFRLTQELGVTRYAILMPDNDPYADRMADLFEAQARQRGTSVAVRSKYPSRTPETWNRFVGSFLGTSKDASSAPGVSYQAVFLPDSWKNMELIVPNLFYFRETRQVLLGTSLWEQGLTNNNHIDAHYYGMGVFPGAWNRDGSIPAVASLEAAFAKAGYGEPDFWAGLGYDFVRFAATLDIPQGWTSDAVNAALAGHTSMPWSMAPITWSPSGKATQQLFLFTPVNEGFVPADPEAIKARFNKAWKR